MRRLFPSLSDQIHRSFHADGSGNSNVSYPEIPETVSAWVQGPYAHQIGKPLTLDARGSYSTRGDLVTYEWDLDGDGQYEIESTGPMLAHTWESEYVGGIHLRSPFRRVSPTPHPPTRCSPTTATASVTSATPTEPPSIDPSISPDPSTVPIPSLTPSGPPAPTGDPSQLPPSVPAPTSATPTGAPTQVPAPPPSSRPAVKPGLPKTGN